MLGRSDGLEEEVGLTRDQSQGGGVNSYNISTVIFQVWNENISHDKTNIAGYSKGEVSSTTRKKNAARCYSKWKKGGKEYCHGHSITRQWRGEVSHWRLGVRRGVVY